MDHVVRLKALSTILPRWWEARRDACSHNGKKCATSRSPTTITSRDGRGRVLPHYGRMDDLLPRPARGLGVMAKDVRCIKVVTDGEVPVVDGWA
jgi:hypothetical protein